MLDRERWQRLSPYLDRALELAGAAREAWLEELRQQDGDLAADIAELMAESDRAGELSFLEGEAPELPFGASLAGQTLGAYTLVAPIGHGGMGTVWLARRSDGRFEGRAAVKLLNAELVGRAGGERFRREGNILARLTHPHIAHLIDAGVSPGGQPFLVLEHVEGEQIDTYCDGCKLDVAQRLQLFLDVLRAVAHAHASLIVHRDIKPSNVLVSRDGQVKLLDFGIAKLLEGESDDGAATALTRDGGRALTPAFAAPEQVTGGEITTATDIYALGALLYLLLCGRHPSAGATSSPAELVRAIVDTEPRRPSDAAGDRHGNSVSSPEELATWRSSTPDRLRHELAGDLDTIVAKALKKSPAERYATVQALGDDVRRFLEHRPIAARPDAPTYRLAKFVRRHRLPVALAGLVLLAVFAGLAGTMNQARRAQQAAAIAQEQRDFALRQLSRAEAINDLNSFLLTDAAPGGKPFTVGDLLARAERIVEREHAVGASSGDLGTEMLIAIGLQYHAQDQIAKAAELLNRAYRMARSRPEVETRARAACALAGSVGRAGDFAHAERLIDEGLRELPEEPQFILDRVFCLRSGGDVARDAEEPERSLERVLAAQRLLAASHQGSELLAMRLELDLAESYRIAGRNREASDAFALAADRLEALGRGDSETAGTLYNNWALAVRTMGNPLLAERLLRRAIEIGSADDTHATVSPQSLSNFGFALSDLGRLDEAKDYAGRAEDLARRRGDDVAFVQAAVLGIRVRIRLRELDEAARRLAAIAPKLEALYPAGHPFRAMLESTRGLLLQARGDLEPAEQAQDRALAMVESEPAGLPYFPLILLRRAELRLERARPAEAKSDATQALDLLRASAEQGTRSHWIGKGELVLGRALAAGGERGAAKVTLLDALAHLEPTLGPGHADARAARALVEELDAATAASARP